MIIVRLPRSLCGCHGLCVSVTVFGLCVSVTICVWLSRPVCVCHGLCAAVMDFVCLSRYKSYFPLGTMALWSYYHVFFKS